MAGRKRNGEGTIVPWYAQAMLGRRADGKPDRQTISGKTFDEVEKELTKVKNAWKNLKKKQEKGTLSVGEFSKQYFLALPHKEGPDDRKGGIKNTTWNWYMDMCIWYIVPNLSKVPISKFDEDKAQAYINELVDSGLSVGTIGCVRRTLNKVIRNAIKKGFLSANPLEGVEMPSEEDADEWSESEKLFIEKDVLSYIQEKLNERTKTGRYRKHEELRFILLTCLYTGMRISEVHGLQIRDIDLKENKARIYKQSTVYKKRDNAGEVSETTKDTGGVKRKSSYRTITMNKQFRAVVEERLAYLASKGKPELLKPEAFVFCTRAGKMRGYSGTRSMYDRFIKEIGLADEGYTLHTFRHTFISHCAAGGMSIDYVSKYVGHADSKITRKIYTHITQEQDKREMEVMNRVFDITA